MALVTVQRSPCDTNFIDYDCQSSDGVDIFDGRESGENKTKRKSVSECYFAVKGAALVLPHDECLHIYRKSIPNGANDIQQHLQAMLYLLHADDILKMAVKLESIHNTRTRYLVVASHTSPQQTEESCLLGIDCNNQTTIGLVLPLWADTRITLDGDGGFSVTSSGRHHIFKPVSVQAMWSALQTLHKASSKAREFNYFKAGGTHQWIDYYEKRITSDRSCLNEWHAMDDLESKRPPSPDTARSHPTEREATEKHIRAKLKEIMMSVDLDEVTCKVIRTKLEEILDVNLKEFKPFIDQEMLTILGQMDAPTEIFQYLFLGSEWNASNLEELIVNGIGYILNVTREIDNFFPGMFDYQNIRVYDDEKTEILHYWDKTYRYIRKAKDEGSKVLVHCKMGISRSASVVIAYVMKAYNWNLKEALEFVKKKRNCIKPNDSFLRQLEIYQGILDASKHRHNSLWRSKSETNLTSADQPKKEEKLNKKEDGMPLKSESLRHLQIPGTTARAKSWSPNDIVADMLFPPNGSMSSEALTKDGFEDSIRLQKLCDMRDIYLTFDDKQSCHSQQAEPKASSSDSGANPTRLQVECLIPQVSSIKDRINELESQASLTVDAKMTRPELKSPNSQSRSGLVLNLATQFESGSKPSSPVDEGLVMKATSVDEIVEPVVSQMKPPAHKHHAVLVKPALWPDEICAKSCLTTNHASKDSNKSNPTAKSPTTRGVGFFSTSSVSCSTTKQQESSRMDKTCKLQPSGNQSLHVFDKASPISVSPNSAFKPVPSRGDVCTRRESKCDETSACDASSVLESILDSASKLSTSGKHSHGSSSSDNKGQTTKTALKQGRKQHQFALPVSAQNECDMPPKGNNFIYDKEDIPFAPGTVQRTKQQLEEKSLTRTMSFDSGFEIGLAQTEELIDVDDCIWGKPVRRSRSLRSDRKPNSMFGRKWYPLPALASMSPKPIKTPDEMSLLPPSSPMVHSISTPSVVEAVNQVICGTQEIIISAIQSLPQDKTSYHKSTDSAVEFGSASSLPDIEVEGIIAPTVALVRSESPIPGLVRQQCEILENKAPKTLFAEKNDGKARIEAATLSKSTTDMSCILVSCDTDTKNEEGKDLGLVKRLTKELEAKSSSEVQNPKDKISPMECDLSRSKAQERLSPSTSSSVSDIGLGPRQTSGLRSSLPSNVEKRLSCNAVPPLAPPTPHRKTSLDLNFLRKSSRFPLTIKLRQQSKSESGSGKDVDVNALRNHPFSDCLTTQQKSSKNARNSDLKKEVEPTTESYRTTSGRPPPAVKLNPLGCVDIRPPQPLGPLRKIMCKQHGSTHPLTRLTVGQRHVNSLYNTM